MMMFVSLLLCVNSLRQGPSYPVYFVRSDSIYRLSQGKESLVVKHAVSPAISPDQKFLAYIREGNLFVYDVDKQESKRCSSLAEKPSDLPDHDLYPSWDERSKFVIFSHADRYSILRRGEEVASMYGQPKASKSVWNVYWYWLKRGTTKSGLSIFLGNETSGISSFSLPSTLAASFSPDGRKVAFCRNGDLWMASLEPGSIHDGIREASWDEARVLPCGTQEGGTRASNETTSIFRISWSSDGKLLALSSDRYGAQGSAEVLIVKVDHPSEKVASFSGSEACFLDGDHILYVKPNRQSQDIWLRDVGSGDEHVLIAHATEPSVNGKG